MDDLALTLKVVLPLFFSMALGYGVKCAGLVCDATLKQMNNLVFRVFLPLMVFYNIYTTDLAGVFQPRLMAYSMITAAAVFGLAALIIPRLERDNTRRSVLIQAVARSNFVVFGLTIAVSLYGQEKAGMTSLAVAFITPIFNVLSVVVLQLYRGGRVEVKRILKEIALNPLIISCMLGLLTLFTGLRLPAVVEDTVVSLARVATPLALVVLGASFQFGSVRGYKKQLIIGVAGRLLAVPAVFLTLGVLLGFRRMELVTLLALYCSPVAVSSFTMAQQMDADGELAGQLVVFSAVFSVITIFGWVYLLKALGLI